MTKLRAGRRAMIDVREQLNMIRGSREYGCVAEAEEYERNLSDDVAAVEAERDHYREALHGLLQAVRDQAHTYQPGEPGEPGHEVEGRVIASDLYVLADMWDERTMRELSKVFGAGGEET